MATKPREPKIVSLPILVEPSRLFCKLGNKQCKHYGPSQYTGAYCMALGGKSLPDGGVTPDNCPNRFEAFFPSKR